MKIEDIIAVAKPDSEILLETSTTLPLNKTIMVDGERLPNPHFGRVQKVTVGLSVVVFNGPEGYTHMVRAELSAEGKDPDDFVPSKRPWGVRIDGTPFITHNGNLYLETVLVNNPTTMYTLDGVEVDYDDIEGKKKVSKKPAQGGLTKKIELRTFKVDSITAITLDGTRHIL